MGTTSTPVLHRRPAPDDRPLTPDLDSQPMPWNAWEVFDPRDGQTKHFTDCERTAEQIAVEEELRTGEPRDYGRKGTEPDGRGGWRPWRPPLDNPARRLPPPEVDLEEDESST